MGLKICNDRGGLISFNLHGIHPHDCATILNDFGVAIRSRSSLCASINGKVRYCCIHQGQVYIFIIQRKKLIYL